MTAATDHRFARSCYGHLAGTLGVALTEALLARDLLRTVSDRAYEPTETGKAWLAALGVVPADGTKPPKKPEARRCLDGTERRDHLGGPLGVRLLDRLLALGWLIRPDPAGRSLNLTPAGAQALADRLGLAFSSSFASSPRLGHPGRPG